MRVGFWEGVVFCTVISGDVCVYVLCCIEGVTIFEMYCNTMLFLFLLYEQVIIVGCDCCY
jgi:hypothetical protein